MHFRTIFGSMVGRCHMSHPKHAQISSRSVLAPPVSPVSLPSLLRTLFILSSEPISLIFPPITFLSHQLDRFCSGPSGKSLSAILATESTLSILLTCPSEIKWQHRVTTSSILLQEKLQVWMMMNMILSMTSRTATFRAPSGSQLSCRP